MDLNALEVAGLYEPAATNAAERLELLEHLFARGLTIDELVDAHRRGRLPQAGAERGALEVRDPMSLTDLAERAGVSVELITRVRLALGLPTEAEAPLPGAFLELFGTFQAGSAIFGEEATLAFARVLGEACARVESAATGLFALEVAPHLSTELQIALAVEAANGALGLIPLVFAGTFREHLAISARRQAASPSEEGRAATEGDLVAVGFVDLVDSTAWAEALSLTEHAAALARFERAAWNLAVEHGGRMVKLIGDEAMFVAPNVAAAAAIAIGVCRVAASDDALPDVRGAIGFGPALSRDGDYFGPLVNLVARCVKLAPFGGVLLTGEAKDRLDSGSHRSDLDFEPFGSHQVRGVDSPVDLFLVSRPSAVG